MPTVAIEGEPSAAAMVEADDITVEFSEQLAVGCVGASPLLSLPSGALDDPIVIDRRTALVILGSGAGDRRRILGCHHPAKPPVVVGGEQELDARLRHALLVEPEHRCATSGDVVLVARDHRAGEG